MDTSTFVPHAEVLRRDRITAALEQALVHPLVTLPAPMGYGKTMAIRALMARRKEPAYYFAVSRGTDSARYLWDSLCGRLEALGAPLASLFRNLGFPEDPAAIDRVLQEIRAYPGTDHILLIFDDWHFAAVPAFDFFLDRLVREHIPGLTVLLASRVRPGLNLEDLRVKGLAQTFEPDFLAFSEVETCTYFGLHGIADATVGQAAWKDCDGWPAALWLRAREHTSRGTGNSLREAVSSLRDTGKLLESVVFAQCDSAEQRLLLQLSPLDSFTPEQAALAADDPAAPRLLERLRERNAFVQEAPGSGGYCLHGMFRAFLEKLLEAEASAYGIDKRALRRRLGECLLAQGDMLQAARYFSLAGRDEDLLRLLELFTLPGGNGLLFLSSAEIVPMVLAVPWRLRLKRPMEYLHFIYYCFAEADLATTLHLLEEAEQRFANEKDIPAPLRTRLQGECLLIRSIPAFNDLWAMRDIYEEAHRLLAGRSCISTRQLIWNFACPHAAYLYLSDAGTYRSMVELVENNLHHYQELSSGCSAGAQELFRAEYTLETAHSLEQRAEIEALLDACVLRADMKEQTTTKIMAAFCRARLRLAEGRDEEAVALLEAWRPIVGGIGHIDLETCLDLALGYIHACLGRPEHIPAWLWEESLAPARTVPQMLGFIQIVRGKAALAAGEYARLSALALSIPTCLGPFDNLFGHVHAGVQQAVAALRLHGADKALPVLRQALELARPDSIMLSVAEYGGHVLPLLLALQERGAKDAYLAALIRMAKRYLYVSGEDAAQRLTLREEKTLRLAAQGLSNAAIAEALSVSPETVKKTLSAAYKRLGAANRAEAVRRFLERD